MLSDFLRNAQPKGILKKTAEGANAVVSTADIHKLSTEQRGTKLRAVRLPDSELFDILRLVKEGTRPVFAEASISIDRINVQPLHSIQTFVNANRLVETPKATTFLSQFGLDLNQPGTYLITAEGSSGKYISIFLPPIITNYDKSRFGVTLGNLESMVISGQTITIKGLEGDTTLDLATILDSFRADLEGPSSTIPVVLDGNHRAYLCYLANVPMNAIVITGEDTPRNVPVRLEDIIVVLERPKESAKRYLGMDLSVLKLNLADLGIGQNRPSLDAKQA
ncbi:MAG: hypothetical protein ACYCO0_01280 [Candidatus Micrarchaeaceae archaeon]